MLLTTFRRQGVLSTSRQGHTVFVVSVCRLTTAMSPAEVDARLAAAFAVAAKDVVRLREAAAGDAAGGTDTSTMAVFELTRRSM